MVLWTALLPIKYSGYRGYMHSHSSCSVQSSETIETIEKKKRQIDNYIGQSLLTVVTALVGGTMQN